MRERNRRAREYSRLCRTRRWCRHMWVVAIVLWVMLLVLVAWCLTASGLWVDIGEAVAVDPDVIPLGSTVTLGGKTYIAADTGVYGYTVDVLMSHEDAAQAGVVKALVKWE